MNKDELRYRIERDEDFIYCPRLENSLSKLIYKYPHGVENDRIAKLLLISEKEVEELYESALVKFRKILGV